MANIRRETGRHDWRDQKLALEGGRRMGLLCFNCLLSWDPQYKGSPPLTGCLHDIKLTNLGDSRLKDYAELEMRRRADHDAKERRAVVEATRELSEAEARRYGLDREDGVAEDREPLPPSEIEGQATYYL